MFESILIVMFITFDGEYVEIEHEKYYSRVSCLADKKIFDTTLLQIDTSNVMKVDTMCDNIILTGTKL